MRIIQHALAAIVLAALALPHPAPAANAPKAARKAASVEAILITASNKKGGVDPKLAAYAAHLKRNFPFDTFRHSGGGGASLPSGGRATINLPGGQRLELEDDPDTGIRLKVYWMVGSEVVISTTLTLNPGIPAALARRPADDGDVPIVLLIAR